MRPVVMTPRALVPLLLVAGLLGGCGGDDDDPAAQPRLSPAPSASTGGSATPSTSPGGASPTASSPSSPSAGTPAADGPGSPVLAPGANADQATGPATGSTEGTILLEAVRLAPQDGFDRLVFAFQGDATPEFVARYVEPPVTEDGSGEPVEVAGSAYLSITMLGASGVDLSGPEFRQVYRGPERLTAPGLGAVQEVVETGDFEATLTWVLGVDARRPFTVRSMAGPGRVVVDVRTG